MSIRYFWWTEVHCDRFTSRTSAFSPSESFHQRPKLIQSSLADAMLSRRLRASRITHLKERRRIVEDLNLHQHYCEDLTPRREWDFYMRSAYSTENSIMTATPLSSPLPYSITYSFAICLRCFSSIDKTLLKYELQEAQRVRVYTRILFTLETRGSSIEAWILHRLVDDTPVFRFIFL